MHQAFRCLKIVFFIIDVKRLPIFVVVICYKLVPTEKQVQIVEDEAEPKQDVKAVTPTNGDKEFIKDHVIITRPKPPAAEPGKGLKI